MTLARRIIPCLDVDAGREQGAEESEALEVVHVEVREHDVQLGREIRLHRDAERTHAGAGVEHECLTAFEAHLHARGVPSVLDRVGAGRRH